MSDNKHDNTHLETQAAIARLERFSKLTDSSIGIPLTKFNIGLEAVIGLIPKRLLNDPFSGGNTISSYLKRPSKNSLFKASMICFVVRAVSINSCSGK